MMGKRGEDKVLKRTYPGYLKASVVRFVLYWSHWGEPALEIVIFWRTQNLSSNSWKKIFNFR